MVSLNLTFFIVLGLFLGFLWALNRYVIQPLLRVVDEREAHLSRNLAMAREARDVAQRLTQQYTMALFAARRSAAQQIEEVRRQAMAERAAAIAIRKRQEDETIRQLREEALTQLAAERDQIRKAASDLTVAIADHIVPRRSES